MLLLPILVSLLPFSAGAVIEPHSERSTIQRRELQSWLMTAKRGETIKRDNTVYEIVRAYDPDLAKRQYTGSCPNPEWREREVVSTEHYWSEQEPLPGACVECYDSETECPRTDTSGWSVSQSISFGMDGSLAGEFAKDISGNAGLNFGYSWTKGWEGSTSFQCTAPAGKGQVATVRHLLGKATTRSRMCKSSCINDRCEDWQDGEVIYVLQDEHGLAIEPNGCITVDDRGQCLAMVEHT